MFTCYKMAQITYFIQFLVRFYHISSYILTRLLKWLDSDRPLKISYQLTKSIMSTVRFMENHPKSIECNYIHQRTS